MLLAELSQQFKSHDMRLTIAMAVWQTITPQAVEAVDAIHLMSYDAPGRHSTLETAQADVQKLLDAGVPAHKIRLGLPFYGRDVNNPAVVETYAEIVAGSPTQRDSDQINDLYFNGPKTIQAKIQFAKQKKLGGVMIWEIGQDAPGNESLLKVIHKTTR